MKRSSSPRADGAPLQREPTKVASSFFGRPRVPWFVPLPNWRFSALFAVDLLLVFVAPPLLSRHGVPQIIEPLVVVLATAGTLALVSDRRAVQLGVLIIVALAAVSLAFPAQLSATTTSVLLAVCALLITVFVGQAVYSQGEIDAHRVAGGMALYLNVSLVFAASYVLLSDFSPSAFTGLSDDGALRTADMVHFSLTTLTTVGYGDIVPRSPVARSMADFEALIGQLFPATLLARLVGLANSRH